MPPAPIRAQSRHIQTVLLRRGLTPDHLQLIGSFIVVYGMFETTLERALWALTGTNIEGTRPFTESMQAKDWFKLLGQGSPDLSEKCNAVLRTAESAAVDLLEYRNSLAHGAMLLSFGEGPPSFMKNPRSHGATGRKRPEGDAFTHGNFQDMALVSAWTLWRLVSRVEIGFKDAAAQLEIEGMRGDVARARLDMSEGRHWRSAAEHEKN